MRVVQGTIVKTLLEFTDPDSGDPADPVDVIVWIWQPGTALTGPADTELRYSLSQITRKEQGAYLAPIDTSPAHGVLSAEVEGTGTNAIVERFTINVTPRLAADAP